MAGQFTLGFDPTGADPTNLANYSFLNVIYDETDPTLAATQIQTWLHSFAPIAGVSDATHATVNAIDPHTFVIDFGAATQGLDQSALLQYVSPTVSTSILSSAVPRSPCRASCRRCNVTTLDRPFTINNIPVSQTDPKQTAQAIEKYFQQQVSSFTTGVAPFSFPTPQRIGDLEAPVCRAGRDQCHHEPRSDPRQRVQSDGFGPARRQS